MAVNITKTSHFTGGAGNPISFSQIYTQFGGNATNIKASTYLRNDDDAVDWNDDSTITTRVPDATENANVTTDNDWSVNSLRDTITNYLVTQSGTDTELDYSDNDTSTWNNNLSKNVPKTYDVTGIVHADSPTDDALRFDGNLYNLEIEVDENGAVYGESSDVGGNGGDALYVNNTYTQRDVKIRSYGKIWAGGGGGSSGTDGNKGSGLACYNVETWNYNAYDEDARNIQVSTGGCKGTGNRPSGITNSTVDMYAANPNSVRSRCRGRGTRASGGWDQSNKTGYGCSPGWTAYCSGHSDFTASGGGKGTGGNGGVGRGWSNRNLNMNQSPHKGNDGNNGNTNNCSNNRTSSTGNAGNPGNSGGDWGQPSTGSQGSALLKKNARFTYKTDDTVKGKITDI